VQSVLDERLMKHLIHLQEGKIEKPKSPRHQLTPTRRTTASVIFYNGEFGFAKRADDGTDIFLSGRALEQSGIHHDLVAGQRIAFDIATGTKGPRAINVALLD
jgi:cold shock CspA family protein